METFGMKLQRQYGTISTRDKLVQIIGKAPPRTLCCVVFSISFRHLEIPSDHLNIITK